MKKYPYLVFLAISMGCSSPTAPTQALAPIINSVTPPVTPVTATPALNPLLQDPQFSLSFYRDFALSHFDTGGLIPLKRWQRAPMIYLRTVDDQNQPVRLSLLDQTAAAVINTTSLLTGGTFGVMGLERGTGTRAGQPGWITLQWSTSGVCGHASDIGVEGVVIAINHARNGCSCPTVIRHELGHALGYYHTGDPKDVMFAAPAACDAAPSEREIFHARIAYQQPHGSFDPR